MHILRRLSDYLDGDLPPRACKEIRAHVATCTDCAALCNTLRITRDLCRKLPSEPVPPDIRRALRDVVRAHQGRRRRPAPPRRRA
jgi:anti-sigma factor RsiW